MALLPLHTTDTVDLRFSYNHVISILCRMQDMDDIHDDRPDRSSCLFGIASTQHGYFTAPQARTCGFGWSALTRHAQSGRFIRVARGLYRLRDYPSSPHEEVVAAWLAVGPSHAVVSHESALDLLELSDIIPDSIHLTVPRSMRYLRRLPGVTIHTLSEPLRPDEVISRNGIRLTSPARTILDSAAAGAAPEQIELAVVQSVRRGLVAPGQLERGARERGGRVGRLVVDALQRLAS